MKKQITLLALSLVLLNSSVFAKENSGAYARNFKALASYNIAVANEEPLLLTPLAFRSTTLAKNVNNNVEDTRHHQLTADLNAKIDVAMKRSLQLKL